MKRVLGGRYELGRRIGAGGMGLVYLARDRLLERDVAVKVLSPELAADPRAVARFRGEARAAASLNHPAVVAVFDSGSEGPVHYLVTEYVEGRTVGAILRERGPLPVRRAVEIAARVARALAAAHRADIVHRDVKPGNVMVAADGGVKIMDFGIARAASSGTFTATGVVLGTVSYLSPEQVRGGTADARSDLYSLGAMLYEMVTGRPPFVRDTPLAVAYQHLHGEPVRPSARHPAIPAAVDAVIMRALSKDPEQRHPHAEALAEELERLLAHADLPTVPVTASTISAGARDTGELPPVDESSSPMPSPDQAPAAPSRRGRWLVAAALAASLAISVPMVAVTVGDPEPQQRAPATSGGSATKDKGVREQPTAESPSPAASSAGGGGGVSADRDGAERGPDGQDQEEDAVEQADTGEDEAEPSPSPSASPSPSPSAEPSPSPTASSDAEA